MHDRNFILNTPKVIGVIVLSLLLTLALFIFGFLFTMKMTVLNTSYANSRLDSFPLASLVEEAEFDEFKEHNPKLVSFIKDVIKTNEEELKEQIKEAVNVIYSYLNGKTEDLDMVLVLKNSIFDPDFTISIIERTDLIEIVKELVAEMTKEVDLPYGLLIESHIDDIAKYLEPWFKEQVIASVDPIYDYILGLRQNVDVTIQLEIVRETLRSYLIQDFLDSPPVEYAGLSIPELEQKFDDYFYSDFATDIWSTIEIDLELIGSDIQSEVTESLKEVEKALSESRKYIGLFNAIYNLLIGFMLLLLIGIILIHRDVKGASRILGSVLFTFGIINLIAVFLARSIIETQIAKHDEISSLMNTWLTHSAINSLTPLLIMTIVLLISGAILLVVSFMYKRHKL
jgi:hypothetical protein